MGDQGKLFGSVTSQELADLLDAKGISLDKRKIQIAEPIKTLGFYEVPVRLHPDVTATLKLVVAKA